MAKKWTIPRADMIVASSSAEADMLKTRYHVSAKRITVILTPIGTKMFRPLDREEACHKQQLAAGRRYYLFVGRLDDRVKRVSLVIRSFAALAVQNPEIDLLVIGDGRDGETLREQAAELAGRRVRFFGWTSEKSELTLFYNIAECLVLPSRSEGFPTVIGEAMACGTPVIASRVGGVSELVVEGETGWTFDPADETSFANRLSYAMSHPALLASMRDRARQMAEERVSPSVVASALRQCFVKR